MIEKKGAIKFHIKEVPTGNEICSNQLYKLIDKIENVNVDEKQIKPFLENIYKKLEWLTREELIKRFVSAEFNRFLKYYKESNTLKASKSKKRDSRNRNTSNKNLTKFSINIGRKHRATPLDIISIINRSLKSNDIEIGKIELSRYHTVFEIDSDYKEEFTNNIKKIDFKGNELVLENNFGDSFQKTLSNRKSKNRFEVKGRSRNKSRRRNRSKNRYK